MPRKGEVPKRKPLPDPKFTDAPAELRRRITKFINVVMKEGKKNTAERIVYEHALRLSWASVGDHSSAGFFERQHHEITYERCGTILH